MSGDAWCMSSKLRGSTGGLDIGMNTYGRTPTASVNQTMTAWVPDEGEDGRRALLLRINANTLQLHSGTGVQSTSVGHHPLMRIKAHRAEAAAHFTQSHLDGETSSEGVLLR